MIIRLSLCGFQLEIFGLISVNFCYLKMISENIGLFQILDSQILGLNLDIQFYFEHFTKRFISF